MRTSPTKEKLQWSVTERREGHWSTMERGEHVTYSGAQNEVEGMAKLKIANVDQN